MASCQAIFMADKARDLTRLFHLSDDEEDRVTEFKEALDNLKIEFSEITGFDYDEATKCAIAYKKVTNH